MRRACYTSAYYCDIYVGSIACPFEKGKSDGVRGYSVLAPYRGLGIGTKLLNHVLDLRAKQAIGEIYLHVQTNNDDAIEFYQKFGFEITETIQNNSPNLQQRNDALNEFLEHLLCCPD